MFGQYCSGLLKEVGLSEGPSHKPGGAGITLFQRRRIYSIAANTSSSGTVAKVVAKSDIP
jgi:hypothetical protein